MMGQEIERKFLLKSLPDTIRRAKSKRVLQAYLASSNASEVRIRKMGWKHFLTTKSGSGIQRTETEIPLKASQFKKLWNAQKDKRISKTRFFYPMGKHLTLEIDEYDHELEGLITAEVEFPTLKEARNFQMPAYFDQEITFDPRFKNKNLARMDKNQVSSLFPSEDGHRLVGTIPYYLEDQKPKVILVTTRGRGQWIFPKGNNESDLSETDVALMEAKEEAGVSGDISATPIHVPFEKQEEVFNMLMFPILVEKVKKSWDEEKARERRILSPEEARSLDVHPSVLFGLDYLEYLLEGLNP